MAVKLELELEEVISLQSALEKLLGEGGLLWDDNLLEWELGRLLSKVRDHLDEVRNLSQKLERFDEDEEIPYEFL